MTSTIVPPVDLAPGMPSRVVTISATDVTEGGTSLEGQMVRFALSDTLDVTSGGDVIAKTQAEVVLDSSGEGSIRLPVYSESVKTWCGKDWAILVTTTWGSQKAIRVPGGSGSVALAALPPVRPLRGRELQWAITSASVSVSIGASPGGTATVSGGNLHLALTIPPAGDGAVLGTESLDTITSSGLYRQVANATATLERGYPVAGIGGTLRVELRSNSLASQWWTPQGVAPYSQYFRRGGLSGWTEWEGIPTTKNRSGPEIGTTPLDQILETGVYRQIAAAQATLARGYPVAGMSGTLRVEERSNGLVSQVYTTHDYAPYSMYWRRGTTGSWTDWEGIETTSSRQGPFLGDTHLDTLTKTGTHRQAYPNFIPGNGYPPGAGVGVLQVFHRSEGMALQVYWTVGAAMEAQGHYRVSTPTGWTDWRAFSGGGSGGGADEADLLAGYEAAKGNL